MENGHDGTWVAHPGLIPLARAIFDARMKGPNQIDTARPEAKVLAEDLLRPVEGTRSEQGMRHDIKVGIRYLEAWIGGLGCVPLYHLMEDAATAEISRALVWQWIHHKVEVGGQPISRERFEKLVEEEMAAIGREVGETRFQRGHFDEARRLFTQLSLAEQFEDFLTLPAYEHLLALAA